MHIVTPQQRLFEKDQKEATAAVYIKTKRGVAGRPQWTFYTEQGQLRDQAKWPTNYTSVGQVNATGANTFSCFLYRQVSTTSNACTLSELERFNVAEADGISPISTGRRQQYGLQVSGGTEAVRYFLSGEFEEEVGTMELPAFERGRFNRAGLDIPTHVERPNAQKKRSFRALWIQRINAAVRAEGLTYGQFIHALKLANIDLDRKVLADIAMHEGEAFGAIIAQAKKAIEGNQAAA